MIILVRTFTSIGNYRVAFTVFAPMVNDLTFIVLLHAAVYCTSS